MKKNILTIFFLIINCLSFSNNNYKITCTFTGSSNAKFELRGFDLFTEYELSSGISDNSGNLELSYPINYIGASKLYIDGVPKLVLLLNKENFSIVCDNLEDLSGLKINGSKENDALKTGMEHYFVSTTKMINLYNLASLSGGDKTMFDKYTKELEKQETVFFNYIVSLSDDLYAKIYLQIRAFIEDLGYTQRVFKWRTQRHCNDFNLINFSNIKIINSGLYYILIDDYFKFVNALEGNITCSIIEENAIHLFDSMKSNEMLVTKIYNNFKKLTKRKSCFLKEFEKKMIHFNSSKIN